MPMPTALISRGVASATITVTRTQSSYTYRTKPTAQTQYFNDATTWTPFEYETTVRDIWKKKHSFQNEVAQTDGSASSTSDESMSDVYVDSVSYPITEEDTCECITFPSSGLSVAPCSGDAYWGTFEVKFSDGSCWDVTADDSNEVYSGCNSGAATDTYTEFIWCDFVFELDTGMGSSASSTTSSSSMPGTTSTDSTRVSQSGSTSASKSSSSVSSASNSSASSRDGSASKNQQSLDSTTPAPSTPETTTSFADRSRFSVGHFITLALVAALAIS